MCRRKFACFLFHMQFLQHVYTQYSDCWFTFATAAGCTTSCQSIDEFSLTTVGTSTVTCASQVYGTSDWTILADGNVSTSGACTVNSNLATIKGTLTGDDIVWSHGYTSRKKGTCTAPSPPPPPLGTCQKSVTVCNNTLRDCCAAYPEAMSCADGYTAVARSGTCNGKIGAEYWCCSSGASQIESGCLGSTVSAVDAGFANGNCTSNRCPQLAREWCAMNCQDVLIRRHFNRESPVKDRGVVVSQWPTGEYFHMCGFFQEDAPMQIGFVCGTIGFFICLAVATVGLKSSV